jgi:hypothetical protein
MSSAFLTRAARLRFLAAERHRTEQYRCHSRAGAKSSLHRLFLHLRGSIFSGMVRVFLFLMVIRLG